MATPQPAVGSELPRYDDEALETILDKFVLPPYAQDDFIVSATPACESAAHAHEDRVEKTASCLRHLGLTSRPRDLDFGTKGGSPFPVHFDHDSSGWSFQVHTLLAVPGEVRLAKHNLTMPLAAPWQCSEGQKRLGQIGWPERVDPDLIAGCEVRSAIINPGDTTFFRVGNVRWPELPPGNWHEFTVVSPDRRIMVTNFAINPLVQWGW